MSSSPDSDALIALFLSHLPQAGVVAASADRQQFGPVLQNHFSRARHAWPTIVLADDDFVPYAAARLSPPWDLVAGVEKLALADLYLACACIRGDGAAIALFQQRFFAKVRSVLGAMRMPQAQIDDTAQALCVRLLVREPGSLPQLSRYSGRGPLQAWLCIVAVREGRQALRKQRRDPLHSEEALFDLIGADAGSELGGLKEQYREHFRAAFRTAVQALSARERNVLRCHLTQNMTNAQIGALCGVHPGSVKRWMAEIREQLLHSTRATLQTRLGLSKSQVDSIIRLIRSDLDISIELMPDAPLLPVL